MADIYGTNRADTIGPDSVSAGITGGAATAGNDVIRGYAGDDRLDGGAGDDQLWGGPGYNRLYGGSGIDTAIYSDATSGMLVNMVAGGATVEGAGRDTFVSIEAVRGSGWNDVMWGSGDPETLDGAGLDDRLSGRGGADWLAGGSGTNTILGGQGDDTIDASRGSDSIRGDEGIDTVWYGGLRVAANIRLFDYTQIVLVPGPPSTLGHYEDRYFGPGATSPAGNDTFGDLIENATGGYGPDRIAGNRLDNRLDGGPGNDTIEGNGGNDLIFGGDGDDELHGDRGAALIFNLEPWGDGRGVWGIDRIYGDAGNDLLNGDDGKDYMFGGLGDDTIILYCPQGDNGAQGEPTGDVGEGGPGKDTFLVQPGSYYTTVSDFTRGEDQLVFVRAPGAPLIEGLDSNGDGLLTGADVLVDYYADPFPALQINVPGSTVVLLGASVLSAEDYRIEYLGY